MTKCFIEIKGNVFKNIITALLRLGKDSFLKGCGKRSVNCIKIVFA